MSERRAAVDAFLSQAGWHSAARQSLAGDLSTRRYERLFKDGASAILMDAEDSMAPFLRMTAWLRDAGVSAPEVLAEDAVNGLILLEDFGDTSINTHIAEKGDATVIDNLCIDLLLALRAQAPPPLADPDAETLVEWTRLADAFYPGIRTTELDPFRLVLLQALRNILNTPHTISLRDFHADNLMWLPDRPGINALGLLDYQDAFLTHPAYDLVSYLTDARVEVTRSRRNAVITAYLNRSGDNETQFQAAFAALSAQRNLRILGIFAKGARFGKAHHVGKLPRVHSYFVEALEHEIFRDVRNQTIAALPDPNKVIEVLS